MKPNFALSLSFEGIRLLHRAGTGWTLVGEVPLDSPDLAGELAVLRKTAVALDPAGLRSKIILPNDQVRYLAIDSTRATEEDIHRLLEGSTPYRLEDLAWDVVRGGGRTYVAAVARETLDEAESFAADHRFGPVSFTAVPEEFTFVGEPFLGQTRAAAALLPPGESVERDAVPVRLSQSAARPTRPREEAPPPAPAETAKVAAPEVAVVPPPAEDAPAAVAAETEALPATPDKDTTVAAEPVTEPAPMAANLAAAVAALTTPDDIGADKVTAPPDVETAADAPDPVAAENMAPKPEADDAAEPAAAEPMADTAPTDAAPPRAAPVEPAPVEAGPVDAEPVEPATVETAEREPAPEATGPAAPPPAPPPPAEPAPNLETSDPAPDPAVEAEPAPVFASRMRSKRALVADPKDRPPAPPVPSPVAGPVSPPPAERGKDEPVFSRRTPPPVSAPVSAPASPPPPPHVAVAEEPVLRAAPLAAPTPVAPAAPTSAPPVGSPVRSPVSRDAPGRISIDTVAPAARPGAQGAPPRITGVALGASEGPTVVPFAPPRPAAVPPPSPEASARIAAFPQRAKPADPAPGGPAKLALAATPSRGKPRFLGLILTLILIVLMVIVALWVGRTDNAVSRFFGGGAADATAVAAAVPVAVPLALPTPDATVAAPALQPATESPADIAADISTDMDTAALTEGDDELALAIVAPVAAEAETGALLPDAVAAAAAAALVAEAMSSMSQEADTAVDPLTAPAPGGEIVMVTPEEAEQFYAATGVWLRAPRLTVTPQAEDLSALALPAGDGAVALRDSTGLPPLGPDVGLVAQANPPPAGTRLPRDERGFILATPEGTVTPDGLVIFAGLPAVVPQARPGTIAPEAETAEDTEEVAAAEPPPDGQPMTEPPAVRPQARTAEAVPETPDETAAAEQEDATGDETAPGAVSLAGLRPEARPESVAALAPPPPLPSFDGPRPANRPEGLAPAGATSDPAEAAPDPVDPQAALAQTLASIVEGAGDPLATATPQAVAVARRPDARPANFARVVQQQTERLARATQTAQQQTAPASLGTPPSQGTPEESAETEAEEVAVAAAAPSGFTPRSVADAATMQDVMALREINLIGVYGTPNDRRALVRLANGRYVRVSVGDSLDGGQVAAISDNALNYIRRGRTVTLQIPGG